MPPKKVGTLQRGGVTQASHKFLKGTAVKDLSSAEAAWHRSHHAVVRVTHALERKADEQNVPRPIRQFEGELLVFLHYHFTAKKSGKARPRESNSQSPDPARGACRPGDDEFASRCRWGTSSGWCRCPRS